MADQLADYENPPVMEVVFGVQFKRMEAFTSAHFGKYWRLIEGDFPTAQEQTALPPTIEAPVGPMTELIALEMPGPRAWFHSKDGTEVVQVQRDRFLGNWRRADGGTLYPRYGTLRPTFLGRLAQFRAFLDAIPGASFSPEQYELTYINHIPQGAGWSALNELDGVLKHWRRPPPGFLPCPERIDDRLSYPLPGSQGRLHVRIQNGLRRTDNTELLVMDLTARGIGPTKDGAEAWFDVAHEWIVKGFEHLTTDQIQRDVWGKRS